jgi:putative ABC transport system permease protein
VRVRRGLRLALRALLAQRLRAALALGSVALGVAAVLVTSALGEGARQQVERSVAGVGADLLVVRPAQLPRLVARRNVLGVASSLRPEDGAQIGELARVRRVAPAAERSLRLRASGGSMNARVLGTTAAFAPLRNLTLHSGRFLDDGDGAAGARVAVLGSRLQETLFPGEDPIGRSLRIRGVPFEVIGVARARGIQADGSDEDNTVFIPLRTALRRVFNTTWLTTVFVGVADPAATEEAQAEVRGLLRERHRLPPGKPDDFSIQDQARLLALQRRAADSLAWLAGGLGLVALLVSGAGILALMLLSVKERTSEIGLRRAVGARPRDILLQFLAEATFLCLAGWISGVALFGLGAAALLASTDWRLGLPAGALVASLATAVGTGLGFGALPARQAARLPPLRALSTP